MLTVDSIRRFGETHGIHALGWFAASGFDGYLAALRARPEYRAIAYRSAEAFERAGHLPAGIRTVIVLVMDYHVEQVDSGGCRLSNYVRACWNTVNPKTQALLAFLKASGCQAETLDVPQRAAACRAGLGFIGRNAMFYAQGLGSYVGIASVGTDAVLEGAATASDQVVHPACASCGRCVAACPVAAIPPEGYRIDPMRCLSMVNRHPDEPQRVVPPSRAACAGWICGCESCQEACPINAQVRHRREAVVAPEVWIEGMTIPNAAALPAEVLDAGLASVTSPGYRDYLRLLLGRS